MKILLVTNKFFVEDGGSYTAISELCYALNNKKGIFAKQAIIIASNPKTIIIPNKGSTIIFVTKNNPGN